MKTHHDKLGKTIRYLREERRLLQRELADRVGIPVRTLGRSERGEVDLRLSTLRKIAQALGVAMRGLLS